MSYDADELRKWGCADPLATCAEIEWWLSLRSAERTPADRMSTQNAAQNAQNGAGAAKSTSPLVPSEPA